MKIKKHLDISTDDFWYDLTDGGYIKPEEILENKEDIKEVEEAIEILVKFKNSCEDQIKDFVR